MLIEKCLELLDRNIGLIHQHVVMSRTSCSLDGHVRAEIDIILPGVSDIVLNQGTRHRVSILVASHSLGREEANVVTLLSNNNSHLGLSVKLANVTRSSQMKVHTMLRGSRWPMSCMRFLMSATSCLSRAVYCPSETPSRK